MTIHRLRWALALLVLASFAACGGGGGGGASCLPGPGPNYGSFPQNPTPSEANLAQQVFDMVNVERTNAGVPLLTNDATAAKVAFDFCVDMETRGFFDHFNPECEDPGVRLTRAGIAWSTYGENIAEGQTTAAQVMQAWMNSPGHRQNILDPTFTRLGVGVREAAGGTIWTQDFWAP